MKKHHTTRIVQLSVCVPVTFTLYVHEDEDDGWIIDSIRSQHSEHSVRALHEHMKNDDYEDLNRVAAQAKDEP